MGNCESVVVVKVKQRSKASCIKLFRLCLTVFIKIKEGENIHCGVIRQETRLANISLKTFINIGGRITFIELLT